jgi:hypothetical protein
LFVRARLIARVTDPANDTNTNSDQGTAKSPWLAISIRADRGRDYPLLELRTQRRDERRHTPGRGQGQGHGREGRRIERLRLVEEAGDDAPANAAAPRPAAVPIAIGTTASRSMTPTTWPGLAPNATRTPISGVRRATA